MLNQLSTPLQLGILVVCGTIAMLALARIIRKRLLARHDREEMRAEKLSSAQSAVPGDGDADSQSQPTEEASQPVAASDSTDDKPAEPAAEVTPTAADKTEPAQEAASAEEPQLSATGPGNQTHPPQSHSIVL